MNGHTGTFTSGVEALDHCVVVREHFSLDVRRDSTHRVVGGGHHGDRLVDWVHTEIRARKLGDIGKLGLENLGAEVGAVQEHVILVRTRTATFRHLLDHVAGDDVSWRQVLDGWCIALHEPLTGGVTKNCSFTAGTLGQQDAKASKAGRVELEELHVLEGDALAPDDSDAITRQGVSVGGRLVNLSETASSEDNGFRVEDVNVSGGQFIGHDTGSDAGL